MSNRKVYHIKLTEEERATFTQVAKGKRGKLNIAAWKVQRAHAMLQCDKVRGGPINKLPKQSAPPHVRLRIGESRLLSKAR